VTVGYRLQHFDALFGYRYMKWNIDGHALDELDLGGLAAGIRYRF
jgi:hypothetical protein